MPFYITYNLDNDCVVTLINGELDKHIAISIFKEVVKVATENGCHRIICDLRKAKVVAPVADITKIAKIFDVIDVSMTFKGAIVIAADHDDYFLWETACHERGYTSVKIFENYEQAKEWVLLE